jgi:hypothetical protein
MGNPDDTRKRKHRPAPGAFSSVPWGGAQATTLAITSGLVGGLVVSPERSLSLLWNVLIPVLPLTFLFGTGIWRSVCPLATLNMLPNPWGGRRRVSALGARRAGGFGIVVLALLVPARRFLFNTDGPALAMVIVAVAAVALLLGFVYDAKAGFCNAICPVLPVERLYGQYPLLKTDNPRCPSCAACTPGTCIDLAPARSLVEAIGRPLDDRRWLQRPLGAFAAAFPGFILGYYTLDDVGIGAAGGVYLHVISFAAGGYVLVALAVRLTGVESRIALPLLAAAASGIYYWFAAPAIVVALHLAPWAATAIRVGTLTLVGVWMSMALPSSASILSRSRALPTMES